MTDAGDIGPRPAEINTFSELRTALNRLRARAARGHGKTRLSLEDIAEKTKIPKSTLSNYLSGATLIPSDQFDAVVIALGIAPKEARAWATAWERAMDHHLSQSGADGPTGGQTLVPPGKPPVQVADPPVANQAGGPDGPPVIGAPVVPRQLPPPVRHFAGRAAEMDVLTGLLADVAETAGTVLITAIDGTAGIGKTALAVYWAHQVAHRFADGQLYVNLRGFHPGGTPMTPAEAVRGFLDAFAVPPQRIPAGLDAQVGLYRSLLAGKKMLVVLDNARDAEQVRPLLPGAPGCVAVVTSRNQLTP